MAKTMTASAPATITDGQIDNATNKFRDALRKHRTEFDSEVSQQVLGIENLGMELLAPFRARVEALSNLITRRVRVNGARTPQQALDATGRRQYVDPKVVNAMPGHGEMIEEAEVFFFKPRPQAYDKNGLISDDRLEAEYDFHDFKPADPYAQAAVNEADPNFANDHPNGTHWKDKDGKWCFATFLRWYDKPGVSVGRGDDDWSDHWWFAGVRK